MKFMKGGNINFKDLTTNKTVLMVVCVIAILNLLGYIMAGKTNTLILFIIIAGLVYALSNKNMTLVFGVPLIIVNLLVLMDSRSFGLEGLENRNVAAIAAASAKKQGGTPPPQVDPSMNVVQNAKSRAQQVHQNLTDSTDAAPDTTSSTDSSGETPESYSEESFASIGAPRKNSKFRVDYASTIEDAYDELNNVLGSDGIKNVTADTHRLLKKQLELTESMKGMHSLIQGMAPLLKQAQGLLSMSPPVAPSLK